MISPNTGPSGSNTSGRMKLCFAQAIHSLYLSSSQTQVNFILRSSWPLQLRKTLMPTSWSTGDMHGIMQLKLLSLYSGQQQNQHPTNRLSLLCHNISNKPNAHLCVSPPPPDPSHSLIPCGTLAHGTCHAFKIPTCWHGSPRLKVEQMQKQPQSTGTELPCAACLSGSRSFPDHWGQLQESWPLHGGFSHHLCITF